MARIFLPLPDHDFDLTEVAVPWKIWTRAGHEVVFATESGNAPQTDPRLIDGVIFGQLGADPEPITFYRELERDPSFKAPLTYAALVADDFDALHLSGGHAPGMRQYLASAELQRAVATFMAAQKPTSAICHGVLVAARAIDSNTGRSPLHGLRTTCLPKYMERSAYFATAWKLGTYYRTYRAYVEDEVRAALASPADFVRGPLELFRRGSDTDDRAAFVVDEGHYLSARWPGDAYLLAKKLLSRLRG